MIPAEYEHMTAELDACVGSDARSSHEEVILTRGSEIEPVPISWLWRHWIAVGKLLILAGAPGAGKTTLALSFAATLSSAGRWPDGSQCEAADVLIWSGEDDHADTLVPRLMAMGADMTRVYFISGCCRIGGEVVPFARARYGSLGRSGRAYRQRETHHR